MAAFLDDAGAFAVVLSKDYQDTPRDPGRSEIGQGVRGDVGADHGLPGDSAAQGVGDRGAEQRAGGGLVGAGLEVHAQFVEQVARLDHDVEQMADRRALVSTDIGDAGLQQRLGHRKDALAAEGLARAKAQLGRFARE